MCEVVCACLTVIVSRVVGVFLFFFVVRMFFVESLFLFGFLRADETSSSPIPELSSSTPRPMYSNEDSPVTVRGVAPADLEIYRFWVCFVFIGMPE